MVTDQGLAGQSGQGVYTTPRAQVVRSSIWGQPVFFTVTNPKDAIQRSHRQGQFYEAEELELIRQHCPPGATFVDVGANIGNHTLFALKFLHAARAILFEPNPTAIEVLVSNLTLNGVIERCDLRHLGKGLSDRAADGLQMQVPDGNLGGGRMVAGDGGGLSVIPGDQVLADVQVDFLKMDVEGMEMQALAGLRDTIARCRPLMFIEVDRANRDAFAEWMASVDYAPRARHKRYRLSENFLIGPKAGRPAEKTAP